jgi:hypothetical protein
MNSIPPDTYERVIELALGITNASEAGNDALCDSLYRRLLDYHDEQCSLGNSHPFLTETLADFTSDPKVAIQFYQKALDLSRQMQGNEPTHTILIGIGTRLLELGRMEEAEAFLRDGRAEAVRREDQESVDEADSLLEECNS